MTAKTALVAALALAVAGGGYTAAQAQGRLTVEDRLDIEQNYARYYHAIDSGNAEAWADTFTADGEFNGTKGRDALVAFIKRAGPQKTRHVVSNLVLEPTAEGAKGSLYVFIFNPEQVPVTINSYSRYDDTLVKTPQGWKFKTKIRSSDTTIGRR